MKPTRSESWTGETATAGELDGSWDDGRSVLHVGVDGSFARHPIGQNGPTPEPLDEGFLASDGSRVVFVSDTTAGRCTGVSGSYLAQFRDEGLVPFVAEDPCEAGAKLMTGAAPPALSARDRRGGVSGAVFVYRLR